MRPQLGARRGLLAQPALLATSLLWGRWQVRRVTCPGAGCCGTARRLHGKECVTLATSFSPPSPPIPSLGRWPEAPVGPVLAKCHLV